jgi:hypothetical protein
MYGLRYPDGVIENQTLNLFTLDKMLRYANGKIAHGHECFFGVEPVVFCDDRDRNGEWRTFSDAPEMIPDWWWSEYAEEND